MLRPFADTCLLDICLKKLNAFRNYRVYFGAAEDDLLSRTEGLKNIIPVRRRQESADSHSDSKKIFQILEQFTSPYVCWINPSHPFLRSETVENAINLFLNSSMRSLTSTVIEKGWFFAQNGAALTNSSSEVDTSRSDGLYRVAHAFHIYERERMIGKGFPWENKKNDPYLFEIPYIESLDIDTEEDFIMVEALYKAKMQAE